MGKVFFVPLKFGFECADKTYVMHRFFSEGREGAVSSVGKFDKGLN